MVMRAVEWPKLPVSLNELCINTTLRCGQSFRWRKSDNIWSCALHGRILSFKQDPPHLYYRAIFPSKKGLPTTLPTPPPSIAPSPLHLTVPDADDTVQLINHYLNLEPNLSDFYQQWSASDPVFARLAPSFTGIRILRQDAWEALIGFICSSNNHISRISGMVQNLCLHYGVYINHIDNIPYHDFPTPQALSQDGVEEKLKELGFGYRAKYIAKTASMVNEKGIAWLEGLCNPESPGFGVVEAKDGAAGELVDGGREGYRRALQDLQILSGVGPKVADCVCLFGLGWGEAVPVDTHVWQIAQRDYKFGKGKHKSLTAATYTAVANHFRGLWGKEAGWAHSVLFTADLKSFASQLAAKVEVKSEEAIIKTEEEMTVMKKEEMEQIGIKREDGLEEEVEAKRTIVKKMTKKSAKRKADDTQIVKVEEEVVMRRSKRPRIFKVEYRDASASPL